MPPLSERRSSPMRRGRALLVTLNRPDQRNAGNTAVAVD